MKDNQIDEILNELRTPKDIFNLSLEEQTNIITLSFIGYVAKPVGISKELLEKCVKAFNEDRGKIEKESNAILKVLEENQ
jgi:hypothetical protein